MKLIDSSFMRHMLLARISFRARIGTDRGTLCNFHIWRFSIYSFSTGSQHDRSRGHLFAILSLMACHQKSASGSIAGGDNKLPHFVKLRDGKYFIATEETSLFDFNF